jgi:hypothetical protein
MDAARSSPGSPATRATPMMHLLGSQPRTLYDIFEVTHPKSSPANSNTRPTLKVTLRRLPSLFVGYVAAYLDRVMFSELKFSESGSRSARASSSSATSSSK